MDSTMGKQKYLDPKPFNVPCLQLQLPLGLLCFGVFGFIVGIGVKWPTKNAPILPRAFDCALEFRVFLGYWGLGLMEGMHGHMSPLIYITAPLLELCPYEVLQAGDENLICHDGN
jgi:hypothetical protein